MAHPEGAHEWSPVHELDGSAYRDCTDPACQAYQEWICALDRWSDTFDTRWPRARHEQTVAETDPDRP